VARDPAFSKAALAVVARLSLQASPLASASFHINYLIYNRFMPMSDRASSLRVTGSRKVDEFLCNLRAGSGAARTGTAN